MPDKDGEVEDILDPELSKEEQRQRKTEQLNEELGEYEVKQSNNYDSIDPQDAAKLKDEILQEHNLDTKKRTEMSEIERVVDAMEKVIEGKRKGRQEIKSHKHHEAYTGMIAIGLSGMAFLYHPVFHKIALAGAIYVVLSDLTLLGWEKEGRFWKFISNHPKFYIGFLVLTYAFFIGAGYDAPGKNIVENIVVTFLTV